MSEVESLRQQTAAIAEQLTTQVGQLALAHEAQKGAWLMLLRHLSAQGYANLATVQKDLEMLGDVQEDAALQDEYAALAGVVQNLRDLPSLR